MCQGQIFAEAALDDVKVEEKGVSCVFLRPSAFKKPNFFSGLIMVTVPNQAVSSPFLSMSVKLGVGGICTVGAEEGLVVVEGPGGLEHKETHKQTTSSVKQNKRTRT